MSAIGGDVYRTAGFTVKNTFLQLDGPSDASFAGASNMKRACSDSAIWENGGRLSDDSDFEGSGDDIQLCGLTDEETDTDGATHIESDDDSKASSLGQPPASGVERQSSQLVVCEALHSDVHSFVEQGNEKAEEVVISDDEDQEESALVVGATFSLPAFATELSGEERALQERLQKMMAENARLATENSMLKKEVSGSQGAASVRLEEDKFPAETSHTGEVAMRHRTSAPSQPQCMGGWVLPSGVAMQTQLACFIVPQFPSQQAVPLQGQAVQASSQAESVEGLSRTQGKKSRTRTARRSAQDGGRADGATAIRGPRVQRDVILPAPVKPQPEPQDGKVRTTVMLRNMPNNYSRAMLLNLLDDEGFTGSYDFLYLPMDFKSRACLGYAFINFVDGETAGRFWAKFDGYCNWAIPSKKVSGVSWSSPRQGLAAHIDNFRNSPVMARSVPDEYKPMVFSSGERVPFPPPTRNVRSPQLGHATLPQLQQLSLGHSA